MKRVGDTSTLPSTRVRLQDQALADAVPAAPIVRQTGLHDLPEDLLRLIARYLLPASPYLARPPGAEPGHFPIAPAFRALTNWGASCKQGRAFVGWVCKEQEHLGFRQIASAVTCEFGATTPEARATVRKHYGLELSGICEREQVLTLELRDASELEARASEIEHAAIGLQQLSLALLGDSFTDSVCLRMAKAMAHCTGLKLLKLNLKMPFPGSLLDAMQCLPNLRRLELAGCGFGASLFQNLSRLPSACKLEYLQVHALDLSLAQLQGLTASAKSFQSLHFLNLTSDVLMTDACMEIVAACQALPTIESLELGRVIKNFAPYGDVAALVKALRESTTVTRLCFRKLFPTPTGRAAVFDELAQFSTLRELRWTGRLEDDCVARIAAMLTNPTFSLQVLDLEACVLGESEMKILATAIQGSTSLRELGFAGQTFAAEETWGFARAIERNKSLLALTLHACGVKFDSPSCLDALGRAIFFNTGLRELHLYRNGGKTYDSRGHSDMCSLIAGRVGGSDRLLHVTESPWAIRMSQNGHHKMAQNRRYLEAGIQASAPLPTPAIGLSATAPSSES